jgi:hypothetical protein
MLSLIKTEKTAQKSFLKVMFQHCMEMNGASHSKFLTVLLFKIKIKPNLVLKEKKIMKP